MKNIIRLMIVVMLVAGFPATSSYGVTGLPTIAAESGVVLDAETGLVVFDKNKDAKLEPASTTKVMTAILALENLSMDKKVIIDEETSFTEGSRIYLLEGEEVTVEELLYALLLESANDAAVALAKEVSGSTEAFALLMNARAKELGAMNTNFVNPHGLHAEGHYSSAYELALIAQEAMKKPAFRKFITTYKYVMEQTNKQPTRFLYMTNRLMYDEITRVEVNGVSRGAKYEGATGIKTGYTPEAGGCLVSGAERDGSEFIAVVLHSTNLGRFGDSIALLDFAFSNYKSVIAIEGGADMGMVQVKNGAKNKVKAVAQESGGVTLPVEASIDIVSQRVLLDEKVKAPVKKGQQVGVIEIYEGEVLRSEVPVVAAESIKKGTVLSYLGIEDQMAVKIFLVLKVLGAIMLLLFLLVAGYVFYKRRQIRLKKKRRREQIAKLARELNVRY